MTVRRQSVGEQEKARHGSYFPICPLAAAQRWRLRLCSRWLCTVRGHGPEKVWLAPRPPPPGRRNHPAPRRWLHDRGRVHPPPPPDRRKPVPRRKPDSRLLLLAHQQHTHSEHQHTHSERLRSMVVVKYSPWVSYPCLSVQLSLLFSAIGSLRTQ